MKNVFYANNHEKEVSRCSCSIKQAIDDYLESDGLYLQILDEDGALLSRQKLTKP